MQAGLTGTEKLWPPIRQAYAWLYQAAHLLANAEQRDVATLQQEYQQLLATSYWDGLFRCYQVKDLPRTNNDLEQYFGTARHIERRVTGRKRASLTLVIRGSVRVVAAGASRLCSFSAADLRLTDVSAWQALRQTLHFRHEGRRNQLRFRRDPQAYLAALEQRLFRSSLPA